MEMTILAKRIREANEIEAELEDIKERNMQIRKTYAEKGTGTIPGTVFTLYTDYVEHLRRRSLKTEKMLSDAEKRIEKQRNILIQAGIDRRVIEKYKEKQKESFDAREARLERNTLDELSALARSRKEHEENS